MANRKSQLYLYCKLPSGWQYRPAAYYSNGTIKPWVAITSDGEKKFPAAKYYIYAGRKWELVGTDPAEAVRALERREGELLVAAATPQLPLTLSQAFDQWLDDVKASGADDSTYKAKRRIARDFTAYCGDIPLTDVTRMHCLKWIHTALVEQGNEDRTRSVKANRLDQFLTFHRVVDAHGLKLLTKADIPKYTEKEVMRFSDADMQQFWKVCRPNRLLMCQVLLTCGLRRAEIASLRWKDIDLDAGILRIQERPEYNFHPKKKHCRDVAIPDHILAKLKEAKTVKTPQAKPESPICFPTRNGRPNNKIWEFVSGTGRRAKIEKGKSHPHVFRSTYATTLLRSGMELPDVAQLLGHKDISTTQRYLATLNNQEMRQQVNKVQFAL